VRVREHKCTEALEVEDQDTYVADLQRELLHSYQRLNVPASKRRREGGQLRDSSIELGEPLEPAVQDVDLGVDLADNDGDDGVNDGVTDSKDHGMDEIDELESDW